jgi:hypothetical protein
VLAVRPVSVYEVPATDATCVKALQPAPWHRSTRYPVTPTLSVDAVHATLIWLLPLAAAVRFVGAVGGCVSAVPPPPAMSPPSHPENVNACVYASMPTSPVG